MNADIVHLKKGTSSPLLARTVLQFGSREVRQSSSLCFSAGAAAVEPERATSRRAAGGSVQDGEGRHRRKDEITTAATGDRPRSEKVRGPRRFWSAVTCHAFPLRQSADESAHCYKSFACGFASLHRRPTKKKDSVPSCSEDSPVPSSSLVPVGGSPTGAGESPALPPKKAGQWPASHCGALVVGFANRVNDPDSGSD